jgi:hypothetical protein
MPQIDKKLSILLGEDRMAQGPDAPASDPPAKPETPE